MATEDNNLDQTNQYEQQYYDKNKPLPDDTYVSRLSSVYPAPKPYTPQQEQQTRNAASMAETLKSLAEIYGQSKGAFLQKRQPDTSINAENKILYDKNKYDTDLREYSRAMVGAMGQDSEKLQQLRANAQKYGDSMSQRNDLIAKAKQDRENKLADDKANREFQANQKKLDRDNSTKNANIRTNKSASEKEDKSSGVVIAANPNDANAISDSAGNKVIKYKMTKDEILNLSNQAKSDTKFLEETPNAYITTKDVFGKTYKGLTGTDELAQMYMQWKYNKGQQPTPTPTQQNFNIVPGGENSIIPKFKPETGQTSR